MTIRGTICFAPAVLFFLFPAAAVAQPAPPAFKAETNLVLAPVVVRDAKGEVVANLGKEDFRLFDNGKEREITSFSLEETSGRVAEDRSQPTGKKADAAPMVMPAHFVALMFDDVHIGDYGDLTYTRNAVRKYLDKLQPADRVAFFTVSGFTNVDFTADRAKIVDAMMKLGTGPSGVDTMDLEQLAITTIIECDKIVSRMALLPGQRTFVFLSAGLIIHGQTWTEVPRAMRMIDHAIRSRVVIDTLDTLGLSTILPHKRFWEFQLDISDGTGGKFIRDTNDLDGAVEQLAATPKYMYVLGFSPGDIKPDGSLHRLTVKLREGIKLDVQARSGYSAPETKEVTEPLNLRPTAPSASTTAPPVTRNDEMVTSEQPAIFKVRSNLVEVPVVIRDRRRGYSAPKQAENEAAVSKQEIEDAVFSRDEIHSLPVEMHTQLTKVGEQVKLNVLTSVDLKSIRLRKADDRNRNDVTIVAALFDSNGNFLVGKQKLLQLRLLDETVSKLEEKQPVVVHTNFDVKPGAYVVRLVARDAEAQGITAENAAVTVQ